MIYGARPFTLSSTRFAKESWQNKVHDGERRSMPRWQLPSRISSTTTSTIQRAQILLAGRHDDLLENQRGLLTPDLHTVPPSRREVLHPPGHPGPIPPGLQATPRHVLLLSRAAIGLASAQANAMRIDITPNKRPLQKPPPRDPGRHLFYRPLPGPPPRLVSYFLLVFSTALKFWGS